MEFTNERNFKPLISVLIILFAVLSISVIVDVVNKIKENRYIGQEAMVRNTFTVTDSAEIYAEPDLGIVNLSVETEASTVAQAVSENKEKMNDILAYLKDIGIEDKDLKTTAFNIYPRYEYSRTGTRTLAGYQVNQTLEVKIRDLDQTGQIIQGATAKGSNQVGNLRFSVEDEDELRSQARAEAIDKVKSKAKDIAKELGVSIVGVVNFSEGSQAARYYGYSESSAIGIGGGGGALPDIETGESKIEATVSVTYEIN